MEKLPFSEKFRQHRVKANFSQAELATVAGVPVGTIRNIEQGLRVPSFATLQKISSALKLSLGDWEDINSEEVAPKKKAKPKPRKKS